MAYGKKSKTKNESNKFFKRKLYKQYLYTGRRSFISYASRANDIMGDNTIKKQLANRFLFMKNYIKQKKRFKDWVRMNKNNRL